MKLMLLALFRASRASYGDDAVGYVCVRTSGGETSVKSKVTPEHKVNQKPYDVEVMINTVERVIIDARCTGCKAQKGGCKHAIAFVFWLLRRSEEESVTQVKCYWKKAALSSLKTQSPLKVSKEQLKLKHAEPTVDEDEFRQAAVQAILQKGLQVKAQALKMMGLGVTPAQSLYLDRLVSRVLDEKKGVERQITMADFVNFCKDEVTDSACQAAEQNTRLQKDAPLWHHLRYGRVTASRLYEVAHCKTAEGFLVESMLGATRFNGTKFMKRGNDLEKEVLDRVDMECAVKCEVSGLFLRKEHPMFGASPDAVVRDSDGTLSAVVEVKCPASDKAVSRYVKSGLIMPRYRAQLQLQMALTGCRHGIFCVAAPDFEVSGNITIIRDELCESFIMPLMESASRFWYCCVYPQLAMGCHAVPQ